MRHIQPPTLDLRRGMGQRTEEIRSTKFEIRNKFEARMFETDPSTLDCGNTPSP
jgi:hypothetical protein